MDGKVVEGNYTSSTDTATHIELYKKFKHFGIRGIVHTHSPNATMWAQMGKDIPIYGTTHADYFYGDIPCTRQMTNEEIDSDYEINTGKVILERFVNLDCNRMQAVLVHSHGPFVWGATPEDAVLHSQILDYIAGMAYKNHVLTNGTNHEILQVLLDNQHDRGNPYNRRFSDCSHGKRRI